MSTGTGDGQGSGPPQPPLPTFLQAARARRTPEQLGLESRQGRGRRAAGPKDNVSGVSQLDIAGLLGVSKETYRRMENGNGNWTEAQVQVVTEALALDPRQRRRLYVLTLGRYPAMESDAPKDNTHLLRFVQSIPVQEARGENGIILSHLMYATDASYNTLGYNRGFEILFKNRKVPDNILQWALEGGDGGLLHHETFLRHEAILRVESMRRALSDDDPKVREFDALIRSLPPGDPTATRLATGLREDTFPYKPPTMRKGWIQSLEFHPTGGTLGVFDGRILFDLTFSEGEDPPTSR
ncbi:helix-turn-helix transcriptional regulator [Streptomyces sp. NPDC050428]|uniref:helix-turn-helix domain-containing protein n=1 Tax=Streptomyces sp. NPDC050428 TaxID=3155757 RepID=UPI00341A5C18